MKLFYQVNLHAKKDSYFNMQAAKWSYLPYKSIINPIYFSTGIGLHNVGLQISVIFSYFSTKTYVVGTQKNRLPVVSGRQFFWAPKTQV